MKKFKSLTKLQKIGLICLIISLGFFCSVAYHYYLGIYLNMEYPFNTFLFRPEDRWNDFLWTLRVSPAPYQSEHLSIYFPFAYIISNIFNFIKPETALAVYLALCVFGFMVICYKQIKTDGSVSFLHLLIISLMSYPIIFTLDRANYEFIVFFALYFFIYYYDKRSNLSALHLGVAIAFKAFPAILAILYKDNRKIRAFITAAVFSLGVTLICYALLPEGLVKNIQLHLKNISIFSENYYIGNEGLFFGNSLFGAFKYMAYWSGKPLLSNLVYYIIVGIYLTIMLWYVLFIEKKFWKKVALLIFALNLFPQMSGDYKLLHIFLPFFLFINDGSEENGLLSLIYAILFGLLLIPKDYARLHVLPEASVSIVLNPIFMVLITLLIIGSGIVAVKKQNKLIELPQ